MSFLSKLALTLGTAASLATIATPAMARPYYGGGYGRGYGGGFDRGYGGYRGYHRDNSGALILGALAVGGIAAIAADSHRRDYDYDYRYRGDPYYRPYYRGYYAPPPPPPPPYEGYYYRPQGYYGYHYGYGY
ncbi:MAG TPA: hypothetical protein VF503_18740 [Sphingobium sp.]|uniref:hypothetical protein n=1 Tax=Sphingobium sp. TaxID=1912891 RepID=UPI002ED37381